MKATGDAAALRREQCKGHKVASCVCVLNSIVHSPYLHRCTGRDGLCPGRASRGCGQGMPESAAAHGSMHGKGLNQDGQPVNSTAIDGCTGPLLLRDATSVYTHSMEFARQAANTCRRRSSPRRPSGGCDLVWPTRKQLCSSMDSRRNPPRFLWPRSWPIAPLAQLQGASCSTIRSQGIAAHGRLEHVPPRQPLSALRVEGRTVVADVRTRSPMRACGR